MLLNLVSLGPLDVHSVHRFFLGSSGTFQKMSDDSGTPRSRSSISSGQLSEISPNNHRKMYASVRLHRCISGTMVAQKYLCLDGGEAEFSLGYLLGWAKKEVEGCVDVFFQNRCNGPVIWCAGLQYEKLRRYIDDGNLPTEVFADAPDNVCFVLVAFVHVIGT